MADDARLSAAEAETPDEVTLPFVSGETSQTSKASRKQYYRERDATRIYLFEQYQKWRTLKEELKLLMDKELAAVLLDFYLSNKKRIFSESETQTLPTECIRADDQGLPASNISTPQLQVCSPIYTSTPIQTITLAKRRCVSELDEEPLPSPIRSTSLKTHGGMSVSVLEETLSASESEGEDSDDDFFRSGIEEMSRECLEDLERTSIESEVYDIDLGAMDEVDRNGNEEINPDLFTASQVLVPQEVVESKTCITFCSRIVDLITCLHGKVCQRKDCDKPLHYKESYAGTCFIVSWTCSCGHFGGRWASQPTCEDVRAGNLLLASAIALSGNSFTKIGFMFKICNLAFFSKSLFYQYQSLYIAPSVNEYWETSKNASWKEKAGNEIILSSDGRNDSPGHCAQYCTYSFADMNDKQILNVKIVDVREVENRKSPNMERVGFERGLDEMLQTEMNIKELVTDGHTEIGALMKNAEKYNNIMHQRDVWHGGKSIAKKIIAVGKEKGKQDLTLWAPAVRNHFWYCSRQCGGSMEEFKHLWMGILHHVVNEHSWILSEGNGQAQCNHEAINDDRQKPWLTKNSPAHDALRKVVINKRFLNTLPYYTNFRHTGFLESFHNHLLMYCPKRHSYSYVGYKMRNQLAAIDFNSHRGRPIAKTVDGKERYRRQYSKRTKRWRPVAILKPKEYSYIPELLIQIFLMRRDVPGPVNQRLTMDIDDPRKISSNIAIVPPPSMEELLQSHQSRF